MMKTFGGWASGAGLFLALSQMTFAAVVPGEFIVKPSFGKPQAVEEVSRRLRDVRITDLGRFKKLSGPVELEAELRRLQESREIEYYEPNSIYSIHSIEPHDSGFENQWALRNTGQKFRIAGETVKGLPGADIRMLEAWVAAPQGTESAAEVVVAVIDTGIDLGHRDLSANIWKNRGEVGPWSPRSDLEKKIAGSHCKDKSCNQIDDDGNGYVDDYQGWNWIKNTNSPQDDHNHGTHVAGIIGASHNDHGSVGINHRVQLMALKFLDAEGSGTLEGALQAIAYATREGADVINASWGGLEYSRSMEEAIEEAGKAGVLFVVAAGNASENNDILPRYPANLPVFSLVSVVATDMLDHIADFSSYGRKKTHLAAPGTQIYSTIRSRGIFTKSFDYMSGTSMAAPHVSGVAALVIGAVPGLARNPTEIKQRLMNTSDILPTTLGMTASGGRLNAYQCVAGIIPAGHMVPGSDDWTNSAISKIESPHPYTANSETVETLTHPGAAWIRVRVGRYAIEKIGDRLEVQDSEGNLVDVITGFGNSTISTPVRGDTLRLVFKSDARVNGWGYEVIGYDYQ